MTLPVDINDFLDPILANFQRTLTTTVQGHLVTGYLKGSAEMLEWGRTKTSDLPIYYEGPPMRQAMGYAQKHTATLVKGINDETREQMRHVITQAVKNKRGVPGLARDLRNQMTNMSRTRSKVIARTETCDALESAFMDRAKDMNVNGKEWVVTDPCEICEANGDAGAIPIKQAFPSGDMRPPAHPNCRCALAPVMLTDRGKVPSANDIDKAERLFSKQHINSPIEYGRAIDSAGRTMLTKKGTAHYVRYTQQDMARMANAKSFIHNHPGGITFSADDIGFARKLNVGKIVAVGGKYKFTASPVKTWADIGDFYVRWKAYVARTVKTIQTRYNRAPGMTEHAANELLRDTLHRKFEELAREYGIKYTREAI